MVVAGTEQAVLMVESQAQELLEDEMLGAVLYGHHEMQKVITAIEMFAAKVNRPQWSWVAQTHDSVLMEALEREVGEEIGEAYRLHDKRERQDALASLKARRFRRWRRKGMHASRRVRWPVPSLHWRSASSVSA